MNYNQLTKVLPTVDAYPTATEGSTREGAATVDLMSTVAITPASKSSSTKNSINIVLLQKEEVTP